MLKPYEKPISSPLIGFEDDDWTAEGMLDAAEDWLWQTIQVEHGIKPEGWLTPIHKHKTN